MTTYSPEFKAAIVKKMMPPNNQSLMDIHRETGISRSALFRWKKDFQEGMLCQHMQNNPTSGIAKPNWQPSFKRLL